MVFQIGLRCGAEWQCAAQCVSAFLAGRVAKFAEFLKKSSEKLVPVFRSGNPCVKIVDDVSQGSQVGVLSLQFSVEVWCAFCACSQIVKWKAFFPSSPGFSSALMLRWCLV